MSQIRRFVLLTVVGATAATALALCAWQLRRHESRQAANAILIANRALPPLDLGALTATDTVAAGRRVRVRGQFLPQGELLLRGRAQQERPGLHVVTPFQAEGSATVVWVLRGFVRSPDAVSRPTGLAAAPTDTLTLTGMLYPLPETPDGGQPLPRGPDTTWRRLDRATLLSRIPGSRQDYLHLVEEDTTQRSGLPPVPPPTLDDGPHLSYAIQWIGIALAILLFGYLMVWRRQPPQRSDL